jgi:hypothetical protein
MESDAKRRLVGREISSRETGRSYSYMEILSLPIRRIKIGLQKAFDEEYR